jgi:putative PIN family toxin of toxin-antitoxin system
MIKVVLDTNELVSAVIKWGGLPDQIVQAWHDDKFEMVLSPVMLAELARVLRYPRLRKLHGWTDAQVDVFVDGLRAAATAVAGNVEVSVVADDPDDNVILACAVEGRVDYVVSGEAHLSNLKTYQGIRVMTAREFAIMLELTTIPFG